MTLIHGECLEELAKLPDHSIDMVMCDLPYGTTQNKWDSVVPLRPLWEQYKRLCRRDSAIVLTAVQPFASQVVMAALPLFKQELIWHKNIASNFLNSNRQHLARHESILVFAFGSCPYYPQLVAGKAYINKRRGNDDTGDNYGSIKKRIDTVNVGTRKPTTLLTFDREVGLHPTQKPVALMEYLINTYTKVGDIVLDNCMGSGTTGIACINTGRKFIGIERDPVYFELSRKRIEQTSTP